MLSDEEFEELARGPKESAAALEGRLAELKSRGAGLLRCMKYARLNQGCSLAQAKDLVLNSRAWSGQKDDFLRQQREMFEEFLAASIDEIESIEQTSTPDGTKVVVRLNIPEGGLD